MNFHVLFNGERWTVLDSVLKLGLRFVLRLGVTKDQSTFLIECFHVPRRPCWCPQLILREYNSILMQILPFVWLEKHAH